MSAFAQPETDSEDELPPGWEERATLGKYSKISMLHLSRHISMLSLTVETHEAFIEQVNVNFVSSSIGCSSKTYNLAVNILIHIVIVISVFLSFK